MTRRVSHPPGSPCLGRALCIPCLGRSPLASPSWRGGVRLLSHGMLYSTHQGETSSRGWQSGPWRGLVVVLGPARSYLEWWTSKPLLCSWVLWVSVDWIHVQIGLSGSYSP